MTRTTIWIATGVLALAACGNGDKQAETTPAPKTTAETTAETPAEPPAAEPADDAVIRVADVGFMTPESVLYDEKSDLYLVSNINGDPFATDGNGFISRVQPDGTVKELKWIDGLDAPKGMALVDDTLYVADITRVRKFGRTSGKASGEIPIKGATFLNGVASYLTDVYVSDSGFAEGFKPSGTDAIYQISADGKVNAIIKQADLGNPNGLVVSAGGVSCVTFGTGELFTVADGKKAQTAAIKGQLDGLVALADGSLLISSWEASAVLRGKPGGEFAPVVENVKAPADIGYDTKRDRVLIPLFSDNAVVIQQL